MEIQCRSDRKTQPFTIKLENFATFNDLFSKVIPEIDLIDSYKPAIVLKMGFPPKPIKAEPEQLLRDAGFGNRERVVVEVNQEMLQQLME